MKVLLIGSNYPPEGRGGTEVHMHQLARGLIARGHHVSVFCRSGNPEQPDYHPEHLEVDGVPVTRINYMFRDAVSLEWIYHNPNIDRKLEKILEEEKPDLVHVHHLTCLSTTLLERVKERDIPVVMTLHDFWLVCPRGQRITPELEICHDLDRSRCAPCLKKLWPHYEITVEILHRIDAELLARLCFCDLLISPSEFHRQRMLEIGLAPEKIKTIRHGLDHNLILHRGKFRYPPRKIGFIGTVIPSKGVHVLIEAINRIGNPDIECHIYGEAPSFHGDGSYVAYLRKLARDDLPYVFHGAYEQIDLSKILANIDMLVVPSVWWESFCLTIHEAMLAGVPVLASDLGAMWEALEPLNLDLLFPPGDAGALAYKICTLATDESWYQRITNLRSQVRTLQEMTDEIEYSYYKIINE